MKKLLLTLWAVCLAGGITAAEFKDIEVEPPAECSLPAESAPIVKKDGGHLSSAEKKQTVAEQKKAFKARQKRIKKLVKQYKKAKTAEDKASIKAKLAEEVSAGVDAGLAYVKDRIAAERANLDNWENKVKADEANLEQVKAQRVEDLLSGVAEKKHKAAKRAWKKQLKEAKEKLH